jgi:hypothetical protein
MENLMGFGDIVLAALFGVLVFVAETAVRAGRPKFVRWGPTRYLFVWGRLFRLRWIETGKR